MFGFFKKKPKSKEQSVKYGSWEAGYTCPNSECLCVASKPLDVCPKCGMITLKEDWDIVVRRKKLDLTQIGNYMLPTNMTWEYKKNASE